MIHKIIFRTDHKCTLLFPIRNTIYSGIKFFSSTSPYPHPTNGPLVSSLWLKSNLLKVKVLDCTWFMPGTQNGEKEYLTEHIPTAIYFNIDEIADKSTDLPHMLPSADFFGKAVGKMGISNKDQIIVYDRNMGLASARAWWTFRIFGHNKVFVLDGGLKSWKSDNFVLEKGNTLLTGQQFIAKFNPRLVRTQKQILENIATKKEQVVDARSEDRFKAKVPEPRPNTVGGHIPGSLNLPFGKLLTSDHKFHNPEYLLESFKNANVDLAKPVVTSCGSGVTAAIVSLAAYIISEKEPVVYDGSWAEWGKKELKLPIEK